MRAMGMFPYYQDEVPGPHTDGTLASVPTGRDVTERPPADLISTPDSNSGKIVKGNIGNTDYLVANKVQYGVFAGDA